MLKMYKVIIVDDELAARETLDKYLQVYAPDFKVVGQFCDGTEALKYLRSNDVDVVFTDVKMAKLDGISVAKWIYYNMPNVRVVIVSGYDEFKYAQEAILYRVLYYLLKVIDPNKFVEVIELLRQELSDNNSSVYDSNMKKFFYNMVYGLFKTEVEMENAFCEFAGMNPNSVRCRVISIKFPELENAAEKMWYSDVDVFEEVIENFLKLLCGNKSIASFNVSGAEYKFITFFSSDSVEELNEEQIESEIFSVLEIRSSVIEIKEVLVSDLYGDPICKMMTDGDGSQLSNSDKVEKKNLKIEFVEDVIAYINDNYEKEISRHTIAKNFSINVDYLRRQFKEVTNKNIIQYIQEKRINKAIEFLKEGKRVGDICEQVGYVDLRNFKRLFKKITGVSIQEYKKGIEKSIDNVL